MYNLVSNSGFDAGSAGWTRWQGEAEVVDGAYRLAGSGIACVGQAVSGIAAGERFDFSLFASAADQASWVGVTFTDAAGQELAKFGQPVDGQGRLHLDGIVAPPGTEGAYVWAWKSEATPALSIDTVLLTLDPAVPGNTSLLRNGDFEAGDAVGWEDWSSSGAAPISPDGHHAYAFTHAGQEGMGQRVVLNPAAVASYALEFDASVEGSSAYAGVQFFDAANYQIAGTRYELVPGQEHYRFDNIGAPAGAIGAYVWFWKDSGTASLVIDDVSFGQSVAAKLPSPSPATEVPQQGRRQFVANGDFSLGAANWVAWEGNADVEESSYHLTGSGTACVGQYLSGIHAGDRLAFSISATASDPGSYVGVTFTDADGRDLDRHGLLIDHDGSFRIDDLVAPEGAAGAYLWAWKSGSTASLTIDDASLMLRDATTLLPVDHPEKIGLGIAAPPWSINDAEIGWLGLSWYYNWKAAPEALHGPEFVPMIWGAHNVSPGHLAYAENASANVILGFNEPDNPSQSAMTVEQALDLWPELMQTGARLGSPAAVDAMGGWMSQFMQGAEARHYRVDFVTVHYYSDDLDVGKFQHYLEAVHDAYGKDIWVTEWAPVDWNNLGKYSAQQLADYLYEASHMMDHLDFVERQSWFSAYEGADNLYGWNNAAIAPDGSLTLVGQTLATLTGQ